MTSNTTPTLQSNELLEAINGINPDLALQLKNYIIDAERQQKETEATLRKKEIELKRYKWIEQTSNCGFIELEPDADSTDDLTTWSITQTNSTTTKILEASADNCIGHKLSEFAKEGSCINIPGKISDNYTDTTELNLRNEKHIVLNIHGGNSGNSIVCSIKDKTETYTLQTQLNNHLQRFELITESLIIMNSHYSYSGTIMKVLERIGFHLAANRILIFSDNDSKKASELKYQWNAKDTQPIQYNTEINYTHCQTWGNMLADRKMILRFNVNEHSDDIDAMLTEIGLKNAYIFPLTKNDDELYGSIVLEAMGNNNFDNFAINYIKIVSILLSGHIARDIITNDLIKEKERAQEADHLKSSFLVNMSHDIRIPINTILGFSDLLADEDLTQTDREEFIDMINSSGNDLITLFDNIIDISKIETGQISIKKSLCAIDTLMKDIMATYKHNRKLEGNDELELVLDLPEKLAKSKIDTDIFKFRQICTNLIDNAIKFTSCGTVKFGISNATDDKLEFYVQDTGIGIAEDAQNIIFQRFSKVDRTFAKEYNGTGLGLSICKSLVEMLGGEIYVVSALGKGSTFYFTHPFQNAQKAVETAEWESKSPYNWEKRNIVIVDNIDQDKKYLNHILTNTGINIIWFNSGNETLNFFDDGNMADIMLVEMTDSIMGAISKIHDEHPISIIAMSPEQLSDEKRTIAMKSGCDEIISKPLNLPSFLRTIDNILAKK